MPSPGPETNPEVETDEVLGGLGGVILGEVDRVDWGFAVVDDFLDGFFDWGVDVAEFEGDWADGSADDGGVAFGEGGEAVGEEVGGSEGGGHEEELGAFHGEEGDLPCDPAFSVGVVVEFVHDDLVEGGVCA